MKSFKNALLFLALSLMFSPQVFAARGVDYNGAGQAVTIADDATGLKVGTGQSIYLANGSTFVTGAGVMTIPGASTVQSLRVSPGNVTVTAGSISVPAGSITVSADVNAGAVNTGALGVTYDTGMAGKLTVGNGILVSSGSTTITAGNLRLVSGDVNIVGSGKGVYITNGNISLQAGGITTQLGEIANMEGNIVAYVGDLRTEQGNVQVKGIIKQQSISTTYVDSLAGTATARAGVRLLKSGAGDAAGIGSTYRSSTTGKLYIKVANSHADSDWNLVTATDAD